MRRFQRAMRSIRYSAVPVVVAPRGRVLGGGAEMRLAAARRQPLAETYIGLVETGVGLIPAGAGTTALARMAAERAADLPNDHFSFFRAPSRPPPWPASRRPPPRPSTSACCSPATW